ncbi:MAG TPA: hypothetical protein VJ767_06595 [Nitrososphaeraceae archaeon]|nr:hypothetical protein [Nitrososphaeraceae archaeon]
MTGYNIEAKIPLNPTGPVLFSGPLLSGVRIIIRVIIYKLTWIQDLTIINDQIFNSYHF